MVICLLVTIDGTIREQPVYWVNCLTAILFLGYSLASFPTRDRMIEILRELARKVQL
ncbi:MAG: hypothetical protein HY717_11120 [Planctomycetes bacterium]|nr:hypothetical protein [Planctomycetota bacterium]